MRGLEGVEHSSKEEEKKRDSVQKNLMEGL